MSRHPAALRRDLELLLDLKVYARRRLDEGTAPETVSIELRRYRIEPRQVRSIMAQVQKVAT